MRKKIEECKRLKMKMKRVDEDDSSQRLRVTIRPWWEEETSHKLDLVRSRSSSASTKNVVVRGHSIGLGNALEVLWVRVRFGLR